MQLAGYHHLTAISANAVQNHRFYTAGLGMRLVKKTVNQDDTSAYHLFYADEAGTPGTDITFFIWPAARERRGTNSIVSSGLQVGGERAIEWWKERLADLSVRHGSILERDGRLTLDFEDLDGLRLSLVVDEGPGPARPWGRSEVPEEFQIRGLGPVRINVTDFKATDRFLREVLGMRATRKYSLGGDGEPEAQVYEMGEGGPGGELHVVRGVLSTYSRAGAGGVHHVAFRAPGVEDQLRWEESLQRHRVPTSGVIDRFYFRSLYFHEPNGILFEIATDEPGFTADEPLDSLGERLSLPPFLEPRRSGIEAKLDSVAQT